jgi:hypothetical protein
MADFTVTIKQWKNTITGEISYYAELRDTYGRIRAAGNRHIKKSDAEQDAFTFIRNIPESSMAAQ